MKEFVAYIVKNLVDHRDQVHIREIGGAQTLVIELTVEKDDIGKVIGKRGRTIRAIRTLLMSLASRHGLRVNLEVIEEGRRLSSEDEAATFAEPEAQSPLHPAQADEHADQIKVHHHSESI